MYIAKRTVRDGVLIAFEGEAMTEEEAAKRGLLPEKKAPAKKTAKKAKKED